MRILTLACVLLVAQPAAPHAQTPLFDFHSAFWMNLHHYLHALARPNEPLLDALLVDATAEERKQWSAAVDYYRVHYGKGSLLFNGELRRIGQELVTAGSSLSLREAKLSPADRDLLEAAASIYRRYRWPQHDIANKRFIANVEELIAKHGAAIASRLAGTYDAEWPSEGIHVDVVPDAGPPGNAYTISMPTRIAIAASDPRHSGHRALELVFHEASHRWDSVLIDQVRDVGRRLKLRAPGGLWHGLLFYNAGAIVTEALAQAGVRDYEMYMFAERTFNFPGWHDAIRTHWPRYLSGGASRAQVIEAILRDLPQ